MIQLIACLNSTVERCIMSYSTNEAVALLFLAIVGFATFALAILGITLGIYWAISGWVEHVNEFEERLDRHRRLIDNLYERKANKCQRRKR